VNLHTALSDLDWLTPQRRRQLARCELQTVEDLLCHFPRRHEDRTRFDRFPRGDHEQPVCVCGTVKKVTLRRLRGRQKMFDAVLEEDNAHALSTPLVCRWFNAHWVEKVVACGARLVVYGKPKRSGSQVIISHPEFEVVEDDAEKSVHLERITPIHRATAGLSTRALRQLLWETLHKLEARDVPEILPAGLDETPRWQALRQIHFPDSWETLARARRHLVLLEFFGLQLCVAARRAEQQAQPGQAHCGSGAWMDRLHQALPFALTGAQQRAIGEIRADLESPRPMNRLLHGDVGSGKTLVALSAMLLAVEAGYEAALMAPTQILAEQHYLQFKRLLEPLGIGVALRTGARREDPLPLFNQGIQPAPPEEPAATGKERNAARNAPKRALQSSSQSSPQNGEARIFVGTHALLFEGTGLNRLGLAVIDEQHKFGVLQRAKLREHGSAPDVLVMTATPIPRTLTMTLFGDLDVSTLDELPANRGKIITAARDSAKLPEAVQFLKTQLQAGRQAYIVYPLIDESEKLEAKAAAAEFARWQEFLAPMRCELLHGRVPPEEKDAIMGRFRRGETHALVATTVIEVGIDVPNANLMLIENAERFGLAQLHQLRGRIGRGAHKSYCVLLSSKLEEPEAREKLEVLCAHHNGFEIAEADLRLRGPGDLLGTAQSGLPPIRIGDLLADTDLMILAREQAQAILARDPRLEAEEHRVLRGFLEEPRKITLAQVS
jgi:ATP-dependent DNA helicase RecG